jgi:hypothetical protein
MQPLHAIEYTLTTEMATTIHRTLSRWQWRRDWRRDVPTLIGGLLFAALISWLALEGWMLPGFGAGLLCVIALFMMGAVYRRWALCSYAAVTALLALHTSDRRVRIEFDDKHLRLEAEFFRGEGTWNELEEIVAFEDFWVLRLSNGGHLVLPSSFVEGELEAFLRAKALEVMAPLRRG